MNIFVDGENPAMTDEETKVAVTWFTERLLGKRLARNVSIDVQFEDDMDAYGYAANMDEVERNPRIFELQINSKIPKYRQLEVMAHETVHIKQMARNELRMKSGVKIYHDGRVVRHDVGFWMGKEYLVNDDTYYELPWEIEAYDLEIGLVKNFDKYLKTV
tara:strand:- start:11985 stop:12464 length:480 start_codon:yes stop_codon:yes gene_type:complete